MTAPVNRLLDPTGGCRRFAEDVAVHWWTSPVEPGAPCQCGEVPYKRPDPECVCGHVEDMHGDFSQCEDGVFNWETFETDPCPCMYFEVSSDTENPDP